MLGLGKNKRKPRGVKETGRIGIRRVDVILMKRLVGMDVDEGAREVGRT